MQEKTICTVEMFKKYLKENLSEKRYEHVVGVAETTVMVLNHYGCKNYEPSWNGFDAGTFCGLGHDISRELGTEKWIEYCKKNGREISEEEKNSPVLLHGYVSSVLLKQMFPGVPESWLKAIDNHTLGCRNMDDLALALYIADYIEPNRTFLAEERRQKYLACSTIQLCAYSILCDIMKHLDEKGTPISVKNLEMKEYLERR